MKHKFVAHDTGEIYSQVIFCEKCGLVAFYANRTGNLLENQKEIINSDCKHSDEKTEVAEDEKKKV